MEKEISADRIGGRVDPAKPLARRRRSPVSALAAVAVLAVGLTGADRAFAFCFSNDSLSHGTVRVEALKWDDVHSTARKAAEPSRCDALAKEARIACKELAWKWERKKQGAADDTVKFFTGLPLVGDAINDAGQFAERKFHEYVKWQSDAIDDLFGKFTTQFRKEIKPGETQCCNWQEKSCNPSGRKDAENYFRVSMAWPKDVQASNAVVARGLVRIVKIGATDHMECRTDANRASYSGCRNFVFPNSPSRPNAKDETNVMLVSVQTGKCLDVAGMNKNNGANVIMFKCTGQPNQRWTIHRDGIVKSHLNGKCLDVSGATKAGKNGANVNMWDCHGALNQRWQSANGLLISKARGQHNWCLDVAGWKTEDGANVHVWQCGNNQKNQTWQIKR